MDCEEIVIFECLGFGWVVDRALMAKVFPRPAGKKETDEDRADMWLEPRRRLRR